MTDPLLESLRAPAAMASLSAADWTALMQRARRRALLGKLGVLAADAGCLDRLPPAVQRQFGSMMRLAEHNAVHLEAEAFQVLHALRQVDTTVVFLKGTAYALRGLQVDRGRVSSDVDILVPEETLATVEAALDQAGWRPMKLSAYDKQYYRRWMHELPPMRHRVRATVIDVHHTLLPRTGRTTPDPAALIRDAVAVDLYGRSALVPGSEDLVVHAAAHLFQDGDLNERLRDLLDIRQMVTEFAVAEGFWERLTDRARLHECGRPVFYALHFARAMLGTAVPDDVWGRLAGSPGAITLRIMDMLAPVALVPSHPDHAGMAAGTARWLLFVRCTGCACRPCCWPGTC